MTTGEELMESPAECINQFAAGGIHCINIAVEISGVNNAVNDHGWGPEEIFGGVGRVSIGREFPNQITGGLIQRIKSTVIIADVNDIIIDNRGGIDGAVGLKLPFVGAVAVFKA